jgi:type I restriction enzyme S subunit
MSEALPSGWFEATLGELVHERTDRVGRAYPPVVLSSTKYHGLVPSDEYFQGRTIYSADLSNYKFVNKDWFAYATNHLAEGSIGLQQDFDVACVSPIYTVFECGESAFPPFLYRILKSPKLIAEYGLYEQASVDRRGAVRFGDFAQIRIRLPHSLAEQHLIAEILDVIDRRISSADQVISKLRVTYSGLMRLLVDQPQVPTRPLSQFLSGRPRNGFSPVEVDSWTGVVVLGLGCLTADGFVPRHLKNVSIKDPRYTGSWVSDGDLLMSRANTLELVGLAGRYRDVGIPCLYPDLMMKLTPNVRISAPYMEIVLHSDQMRRQLRRIAQGTSESMAKISASSVMQLQVQIPDPPEQKRILDIADDINSLIESLEGEMGKLAALKQGLMDDLLTGRVRVTGGGVGRMGTG